MSHFIESIDKLKERSLLRGEIYEIRKPTAILKKLNRFSLEQAEKTIERLIVKEEISGWVAHDKKLEKSMEDMKKKMKYFCQRTTEHVPFEKQQEKTKHNLTANSTQCVYIDKKYHSVLANRLNSLRQCENIETYRRVMRDFDSKRDCSSPNLNKMNYLIERIMNSEPNGLFIKDRIRPLGILQKKKKEYDGLVHIRKQITQP